MRFANTSAYAVNAPKEHMDLHAAIAAMASPSAANAPSGHMGAHYASAMRGRGVTYMVCAPDY